MAVAAASAALMALLAPGATRAHGVDFSFPVAVLTTAAPTLDGVMDPGEWGSASTFVFPTGANDGQVWAVHDGTYLYVAFRRVDTATGGAPVFQVYFDNEHGGVTSLGDDSWSVSPGGTNDGFWDGSANASDGPAGSNDTLGAATDNAGELVFEMRHPICNQSDATRDVCLVADGATIAGITFFYFDSTAEQAFYPAHFDSQGGFGHITLAPLVQGGDTGTIAFSSTRDGDLDIYTLDLATSAVTQITNAAGEDLSASYSGDGSKIVFQSARDGDPEIFVVDAGGGTPTQLTNNTVFDGFPAFSPDGQTISFRSDRDGSGDLWLMDADGTNQRQLTTTTGVDHFNSTWSPDSQTIAFHRREADGNDEIYTIPATGGAATNITNTPSQQEERPNWSNDGAWILFDDLVAGGEGIWRMNPNGTGRVRLTTSGIRGDFSPDGTRIVFETPGAASELMTASAADGSGLTNITNNAADDVDPEWRPTVVPGSGLVVTNTNDSGAGSLRDAIDNANSTAGADMISFDIPGEGVRQIDLNSSLPTITDPVTIDGTTQPGWIGPPLIRVDGFLQDGGSGIQIAANGSTIRGLMLTNLPNLALNVLSDGNTIAGNFIGTDGTVPLASPIGVFVSGSDNTIGGTTPADRNVITGSNQAIQIQQVCIETECRSAEDNVIQGNYIGTNASGLAALPGGGPGIRLEFASNTLIGGTAAGAGNVIGGRGFQGAIYVEDALGPTTIQGNLIGVAANRIGRLGNNGPGVRITTDDVLVGGTAAGAGNVIAYNGDITLETGVLVESGSGNSILGNSIFDNGNLGINLFSEANDDQPAPDLDELLVGSGLLIRGTLLDTTELSPYRLEFFASPACDDDGDGFGEGKTFLGAASVDGGPFEVNLPGAKADGVVTATATNDNGSTSEFSNCVEEGFGDDPTGDVTLTSDERGVQVGAKVVPLAAVPSNQLPSFAGAPSSAPVGSIPVGSIPVGSIPVGSIPVGSIPVGSIPVGSIPVGSIGLNAIPVGSIGLDQVLLSMLPIDADALLKDSPDLLGRPRQTITLADVYADTKAREAFEKLSLAQSGLAQSILRGVPFAAFLLGGATLNQLPPPDASTWCAAISAAGGSCTGVSGTNTVMGLSIAGAPVGSIPVGSIPVGSIPVGSIPVGSIPVGSIDLEASRLAGIPVGSISNANKPLVLECGLTCPAEWKLRDAKAAGAIKLGAQLKHLEGAFPADLTLNDLILGIVPRSALAWESFPIDGLQLFDSSGIANTVRYRLRFTLPCPVPGDFAARVKLPDGWLYKTGTTRWQYGTATPLAGAEPTTSAKAGARWTSLPGTPCTTGLTSRVAELSFQALSGFEVGSELSSAAVTMNGQVHAADGNAPVLVRQNWEANDTPTAAQEIAKDALVIGHIANSGDREVFRLPVPTARGTRTTFYLSHIAEDADFDLVVGKPEAPYLQSSPVGSIPVGSIPVEDGGSSVDNSGQALPPETLQDIPVGSIPVGSISATRGSADEVAQVVADGETGFYTIVVSGYNGSRSDQPFVLRVVQTPPPELPPCQPRSLTLDTAAGALPASPLPAATNTLFVVNKQRLAALYPGQDVDAMLAAAAAVAEVSADVVPEVLPVDGDAAVRNAYAAWDADPCVIGKANDVVAAINAVIASYRVNLPNLKYVVLLGTDESLPMMRRLDTVTISNETDEAADLLFTTATAAGTRANALYAAAALGYFLSDTVYGAFTSVPWLGRDLYLPNVAVGRLVESPEDIQKQLDLYVEASGVLTPTTTLTTGYDFLTDGAQAVADALVGVIPVATDATTIINDTWDADDLKDPATDKLVPHDVLSLNAHYSHWLLQPAAGPTLVKTSDLPALPSADGVEPAFARRILFTMGCHGGLNVADTLLPGSSTIAAFRDWVQGYAQQQTAVYVANTGFGYGDTEANALSERLMSIFAAQIARGGVIGERWVDAVHEYFATAGLYGVYDEKALSEATFYGLPFWRLPGSPTPPSPGPEPTPGGLGFDVATETVTPAPTETPTSDNRGRFWELDGETLGIHYRPIQPRLVRDVTRDGHFATGVLLKSLRTQDISSVDPVNATPTIDLLANEPERNFQPSIFPAAPVALTRSTSEFGGDRQHAVLITGQFRPGFGSTGTERLIRQAELEVAYVSSQTDFTPPQIEQVAAVHGSSATIFVKANDSDGTIVRVAALWSDGALEAGFLKWNYIELDPVVGVPGGWSKGPFPTAGPIQVIAMAQNADGLVGYSANKGENFPSVADTGDAEILVESPADGGEYFLNEVVPLSFACSDAGIVASCTANPSSNPVDTATVGEETITITAIDLAGNETPHEIRYRVIYRFTGFFEPVSNPPFLNVVKAGQGVPLRFSLAGNQGLEIFMPGYPASKPIPCDTNLPTDPQVETTTAGSSGLTYVATTDRYQYLWKTEKSWANSCRRLIFTFKDGKERFLDFKFVK